ncbi:hypothetical protein Q3G72_011318 [Acer saccharum]|nr:hypothetical protein Q3G72_011318 [Acer saccharum]
MKCFHAVDLLFILRPFSPLIWGVIAVFFLAVGAIVWTLEHRQNDDFRGPTKRQVVTIFCASSESIGKQTSIGSASSESIMFRKMTLKQFSKFIAGIIHWAWMKDDN